MIYLYVGKCEDERPQGEVEEVGLAAASEEEARAYLSRYPGTWAIKGYSAAKVCDSKVIADYQVWGVQELYQRTAPLRGPRRCAQDVYALPSKPFVGWGEHDMNFAAEILGFRDYGCISGEGPELSIREVASVDVDQEYAETLCVLRFQGTPFAVAKRRGEEWMVYGTDKAVGLQAIAYVASFREKEEWCFSLIDPSTPMRELTFGSVDLLGCR